MLKPNISTQEGLQTKFAIKKLVRLQGSTIENAEQQATDLIVDIDNKLSREREKVRQYRAIFGEIEPGDWINSTRARLRIARRVLDQAEKDYNFMKDHNF